MPHKKCEGFPLGYVCFPVMTCILQLAIFI